MASSNKSCVSNKTSGKPLNPMASPYHKVPTHHVYFSNLPPYHHHILPPVVPNLLPPKNKNMGLSPFAPVPLGPRFPRSRLRSRKLKKVAGRHHFPNSSYGGATNKLVWVPKDDSKEKPNANTSSVNVSVQQQQRRTRWKNKIREYQEILPLNENTTSLMIKNIPNKYTRDLMVETLDNHCKNDNKNTPLPNAVSAYDFLYLPIDFRRRVNAGFAFVNFTNPEAALRFRDAFHGKRWDLFGSPKIAEISRARIQGKRALISHCNSLDFSYGSEEDMPVYFEPARDGSAQHCCYKMFTVGSFCH